MTVQGRESEHSLREDEVLDLLGKGGFAIAEHPAIMGILSEFAMDDPVFVSRLMDLVVYLIRTRHAYFKLEDERKSLEEHKKILRDMGVAEEAILSLMRKINDLTPRETFRGENGIDAK